MAGREINKELIDIWGVIVSRKIEKLSEKVKMAGDPMEQAKNEGRLEAFVETMTIINCIKQGRFQSLYEESLAELEKNLLT